MKIEVNKKYFIIIMTTLLVIVGAFFVMSYANPSTGVGHSADELEIGLLDIDGLVDALENYTSNGLYGYCCQENYRSCYDYGEIAEPAYWFDSPYTYLRGCKCRVGYNLVMTGTYSYSYGQFGETDEYWFYSCVKN